MEHQEHLDPEEEMESRYKRNLYVVTAGMMIISVNRDRQDPLGTQELLDQLVKKENEVFLVLLANRD